MVHRIMKREPNNEEHFNRPQKLQLELLRQEITQEFKIRHSGGQLFSPKVDAVEKYQGSIKRLAYTIVEQANVLKISPINLSFIFLNRAYPFLAKHKYSVKQMHHAWDEFVIDLSHETMLLPLLNYTEEQKKRVLCCLSELKEVKKNNSLQSFMSQYGKGYTVKYPEHFTDRSRLFETFLVMLHQIDSFQLTYYIQHSLEEILKAHIFFLKKFGDPVTLHHGSFIGDTAMYRLRQYHAQNEKQNEINETIVAYTASPVTHAVEYTF